MISTIARRLTLGVLAATLVLAGCGDDDSTQTAGELVEESTSTDASSTTTSPDGRAGSSSVSDDDLVRFIAAAETALESSTFAGVVFDEPEVYIALGQAACERFADGDSFDEVLADLDVETADDDSDAELLGAVVGAAVNTLCPAYTDVI